MKVEQSYVIYGFSIQTEYKSTITVHTEEKINIVLFSKILRDANLKITK